MPDGSVNVTAGALALGAEPCGAHGANSTEIKLGWGGPREGAGRKPAQPAEPERLGLRWYVIDTHPSAERQVAYELARTGWGHYLPLIATRKRDRVLPTMFHKVLVPMFRGYVFVEFDRDELTWGAIRDTIPGVRGILRNGAGKPSPTPHGFVDKLKDGDAERLELASAQSAPRKVGDMVSLDIGDLPVCGMVLACDGYTTMVSIEMFGRAVPVERPWGEFSAVGVG